MLRALLRPWRQAFDKWQVEEDVTAAAAVTRGDATSTTTVVDPAVDAAAAAGVDASVPRASATATRVCGRARAPRCLLTTEPARRRRGVILPQRGRGGRAGRLHPIVCIEPGGHRGRRLERGRQSERHRSARGIRRGRAQSRGQCCCVSTQSQGERGRCFDRRESLSAAGHARGAKGPGPWPDDEHKDRHTPAYAGGEGADGANKTGPARERR